MQPHANLTRSSDLAVPGSAKRLLATSIHKELVLYMFLCHAPTMEDDFRPIPGREPMFDVEHAPRRVRMLWQTRQLRADSTPLGYVALGYVAGRLSKPRTVRTGVGKDRVRDDIERRARHNPPANHGSQRLYRQHAQREAFH